MAKFRLIITPSILPLRITMAPFSREPIPLASALSLTDEARIITSATTPFNIIHTNRAWSEATGYKFTDVVGRTCSFLQGPDTCKGPALTKLHHALQTREPCTAALVNYTADGRPFHNVITVVATTCGTHFVGTIFAKPITDGSVMHIERPPLVPKVPEAVNYARRENYENAGKRRKRGHHHERLADVLNNTTDPIVLCSKDFPHQITHPNGPWLEMCGYALEEVEGETNKILTGPETDQGCLDELLSCVRKLEPSVQTLVNYKKGGARFINQVITKPVYDENDELAAFMTLLHEIDESAYAAEPSGGGAASGAASADAAASCNPGVAHLWTALDAKRRVAGEAGASVRAGGAAAAHAAAARAEAASKLLSNHEVVLRDLTDASGPPATQQALVRVPPQQRPYVDQALRETARRLLGACAEGALRERLDAAHPASGAQRSAWAATADYLSQRIQDAPLRSGRAPDMSPAAAKALRAVLHEVGHTEL